MTPLSTDDMRELADKWHRIRPVNTPNGSFCESCDLPVYYSVQGWRHRRKRTAAARRRTGEVPGQLSVDHLTGTVPLLGPS